MSLLENYSYLWNGKKNDSKQLLLSIILHINFISPCTWRCYILFYGTSSDYKPEYNKRQFTAKNTYITNIQYTQKDEFWRHLQEPFPKEYSYVYYFLFLSKCHCFERDQFPFFYICCTLEPSGSKWKERKVNLNVWTLI